jgi:serine/threonine protein kinase
MQLYCTRPSCSRPLNLCADLDNSTALKTTQQKFCTNCGMPLILSGRYLPEKLLGQGGFGSAFFARDRYTPALRHCVVKLFQPSAQLNAQQLQVAQGLFEREAAVLEELGNQHPQIPDLYAFFPLVVPGLRAGENEEYFYLVQEFINGENLEQILERHGPVSEKAVKAILVEVLKVLDFVHANGAIHRDIKPSNIMKAPDGKLYLLDFGAVKQVASGSSGGRSTGIYTVGYAPPELVSGGMVYPSSDLYSLAVTCVVMLSAQDPTALYDGYTNQWKWQSATSVQDPTLIAVLNRMLETSPQRRFESAQAALQALFPATAPTPSPPPSPLPSPAPASSTALQGQPAPPAPAPQPRPIPVAPAPAAPSPIAPPVASKPMLRPLPEFLANAAFTGFEGSLLGIAIASLLGTTLLGTGTWLVLVIGLILLQAYRIIERVDLLLIAGGTLALVVLVARLRTIAAFAVALPITNVLVIALMVAVGVVAVAIVFRLIYQIMSQLL